MSLLMTISLVERVVTSWVGPSATRLSRAGLSAASPAACVPLWLEEKPTGRVIVVGAGKAAASMATIVEQQWGEPLSGLVIVPDGHATDCEFVEVVEASHPVPFARRWRSSF